jgi:hypothetical protein
MAGKNCAGDGVTECGLCFVARLQFVIGLRASRRPWENMVKDRLFSPGGRLACSPKKKPAE